MNERNRTSERLALPVWAELFIMIVMITTLALSLAGCAGSVSSKRHQQTLEKLRVLNEQLQDERSRSATGQQTVSSPHAPANVASAGTPPHGEPKDARLSTKKGSGSKLTTADTTATKPETAVASPSAAVKPTVLDQSGVSRDATQPARVVTATTTNGPTSRYSSSAGWRELAQLYREERKRIDKERRRWELTRLRQRISDLQEARVRDALLWSRAPGGFSLPNSSKSGSRQVSRRELEQLLLRLAAQQRKADRLAQRLSQTGKQPDANTIRDARTVKRAISKMMQKLESLSAVVKAQGASIDRIATRPSGPDMATVREQVRSQLSRLKSESSAPTKRPIAAPTASAARTSAPPSGASAAKPAAATSQVELDSQMQEAERLLRSKLGGK
jgi:hypothetical protein